MKDIKLLQDAFNEAKDGPTADFTELAYDCMPKIIQMIKLLKKITVQLEALGIIEDEGSE